MIKQINRMKQLGNQALGRAERTEVLNDHLQFCEKRVENIRHACHTTNKRLKECLQGSGQDIEKRQKKLPFYVLSQNMLECSQVLGEDSILGSMMAKGSEACSQVALELTSHEMGLENLIIIPFTNILENDFPKIAQMKKKLNKLTLDLDSSKAKYHAAQKAYINQGRTAEQQAKMDAAREEMDDANIKMEQCKDALANEMMVIVSKEPDYARSLIDMVSAQAQYHRNALARLEVLVPRMKEVLENHNRKPVFGTYLEEHLESEGVKIAVPLRICVEWLQEFGIGEEGLFRIAGSAGKVKVLRSALNASVELPIHDFVGHEHAVAGALKQYLRELPEPLLTFAAYDDLVEAQSIKDNTTKLERLWSILHQMPQCNQDNFRFLVRFLYKVSLKSDKNKMGASNLALVIGPNVMWSEQEQGVSAATMGVASSILETFITNADYFFAEDTPTVEYISPPGFQAPPGSLHNGEVVKSPEPQVSQPPVVPPMSPPPVTPPPPSRLPPGITTTDGGKPPVPATQAQRHWQNISQAVRVANHNPSFRLRKAGTMPRKSSKKGQAPKPPGPPGSAGTSPTPSPTNSLTRQSNLEPSPLATTSTPASSSHVAEKEEETTEDADHDEVDGPHPGEDDDDGDSSGLHTPDKASNDSLDKILTASEEGSDSGNVNDEDVMYEEIKPVTPPVKEKPQRPSAPKRGDSKNELPPAVSAKPVKPDRPPEAPMEKLPASSKGPDKPDRPDKPERPKPPNAKGDRGSIERKEGAKAEVKERVAKPNKPPPVPRNPPRREDNTSGKSNRPPSENGTAPSSPPAVNPKSPGVQRPRMTPPPPPKDGPSKEDLEGENTHL